MDVIGGCQPSTYSDAEYKKGINNCVEVSEFLTVSFKRGCLIKEVGQPFKVSHV